MNTIMQLRLRANIATRIRQTAQLRLAQRLNMGCPEAVGVFTVRYPHGLVTADEYLKSRGSWGVLFGGVLAELYKYKNSHPEARKDIDVYAPELDRHVAGAVLTGIDFWGGDPATNICRKTRLRWTLPHMEYQNDLEPGLYFMGLETFLQARVMEGNRAEASHVYDREWMVYDRIYQDTGLKVRKIDDGVVPGGERYR